MMFPSGEYSESRPFKIFISLLDKWEIGAPLTQVLVYDSFEAVKHLCDNASESSEDVRSLLLSQSLLSNELFIGEHDGQHVI
jgi:hypothetical protein